MPRTKAAITLRETRIANNLCLRCGGTRSSDIYCSECNRKMVEVQGILFKSRRAKGLCPECGDIAVTAGSYSLCMKCWFKKMSKSVTGTKTRWQDFQRAYEKQQGKCAYTGIDLIPSLTASIDHIIPTSRGGTHEENNLQWVTKQINCMKTDMTHDEFLSMCQLILKRSM